MSFYRTMNLSSLGKQLAEEDGVPFIFLQGINNNWINKNCEVVAVLTQQRRTGTWVELGYTLIDKLNKSSCMGLAVEGSISAEYSQWFRALGNMTGEGILNVREECRKHPVKPGLVISNMELCTIQNVEHTKWPSKFWEFAGPDTFNGCDLLLAFYRENEIVKSLQDNRLDLEVFMGTLCSANGWLIPLDGNKGFVVGYVSNEGCGQLF